jgi:crotonobetainyl-CoA:carnitine CoA-transferase CaiB-like acyl-CoA transferase
MTIAATESGSDERAPKARRGPLTGVRVADFCWLSVGANATRILASYGAEVIKIENRRRFDLTRRLPVYKDAPPRTFGEEDREPNPNRGGVFNNYNRNKLGVTIDLSLPGGRALAERLISVSSVVSENFAPGVMERWGFDYARLRELSPNVIYARMSGYGHSGPDAHYRSYGPVVQAVSGLSYMGGLPGREASGWGMSFMDNQAAQYNAAAMLLAIYRRNLTGEGMEIDVSAVEVGVGLVGPALLEESLAGSDPAQKVEPVGNRLRYPPASPHGVYPVEGDDRWIAITVFDDAEWDRLCTAIEGGDTLRADERFGSIAGRVEHADSLDPILAGLTSRYDGALLTEALQRVSVRAGLVQNARDLNESDPQLRSRGAYFHLDHPVIGNARFESVPIQFSAMEQDNWRSAPLLGEDSEYVLRHVVGLSDDEIDDLRDEGCI